MRNGEIERQVAGQYSAKQAFPSQGPTLDQMFSGQNQMAAIELQIMSTKLLAIQDEKMEKMNEALNNLAQQFKQTQISTQEREKIENLRYKENTRLSRIAAWSGVISVVSGIISIILAALGFFQMAGR